MLLKGWVAPVRFSSLLFLARAECLAGNWFCFGVRPATAVDGSSLTCRVFTSLIKSSVYPTTCHLLPKTARCCSSVDLYAFSTTSDT